MNFVSPSPNAHGVFLPEQCRKIHFEIAGGRSYATIYFIQVSLTEWRSSSSIWLPGTGSGGYPSISQYSEGFPSAADAVCHELDCIAAFCRRSIADWSRSKICHEHARAILRWSKKRGRQLDFSLFEMAWEVL